MCGRLPYSNIWQTAAQMLIKLQGQNFSSEYTLMTYMSHQSTAFAVSSDGSWRTHGTPPLSSHLRPARSVCADFGQQNLRGQLWTAGIGIFSDFFTGQSVWKYFRGLKEERKKLSFCVGRWDYIGGIVWELLPRKNLREKASDRWLFPSSISNNLTFRSSLYI